MSLACELIAQPVPTKLNAFGREPAVPPGSGSMLKLNFTV